MKLAFGELNRALPMQS